MSQQRGTARGSFYTRRNVSNVSKGTRTSKDISQAHPVRSKDFTMYMVGTGKTGNRPPARLPGPATVSVGSRRPIREGHQGVYPHVANVSTAQSHPSPSYYYPSTQPHFATIPSRGPVTSAAHMYPVPHGTHPAYVSPAQVPNTSRVPMHHSGYPRTPGTPGTPGTPRTPGTPGTPRRQPIVSPIPHYPAGFERTFLHTDTMLHTPRVMREAVAIGNDIEESSSSYETESDSESEEEETLDKRPLMKSHDTPPQRNGMALPKGNDGNKYPARPDKLPTQNQGLGDRGPKILDITPSKPPGKDFYATGGTPVSESTVTIAGKTDINPPHTKESVDIHSIPAGRETTEKNEGRENVAKRDLVPNKKIDAETIIKTFLLKRDGKLDCKPATIKKLQTTMKLMRHQGKAGVDRIVLMPNNASNHISGPASGYVLVVKNPARTLVNPSIFPREKLFYGTYALRIPRDWKNTSGKTFYEVVSAPSERSYVIHAMKTGLSPDVQYNLQLGGAFLGVYSSIRPETDWVPELWVVVQCGDRKASLKHYEHVRKLFVESIQVKTARTMLAQDETVDKEKAMLRDVVADRKENLTWKNAFGLSNDMTELGYVVAESRKNAVLQFLNALNFEVADAHLECVKMQVDTQSNFVSHLTTQGTWAYFSSCTRVFPGRTRAVIRHSQPMKGIEIILGNGVSDEYPLGRPWTDTNEHSFGAFPVSTGRTKQSLRLGETEKTLPTSIERKICDSFFTLSEEAHEEVNPRIRSDNYRPVDMEWKRIESILGRPTLGSTIQLKPHLVMCAPVAKKATGVLSGML